MSLLIKNGRVIDPANHINKDADILIEGGKIKEIGGAISRGQNCQEIDASGKIVIPGLVDMHTHLRDPGYEYKEDIISASNAAAAGGFTAISAMPNTNPVNDNAQITEYIRKKGDFYGKVNIFPISAATKNQEGKALADIGEQKEAGVVALSDDGKGIQDSRVMRRVLEYAKMFDLPVISHAEDNTLSKNGVMNEGCVSTELGLAGIPNAAEDIIVARDISLLKLTGSKLHIAHVSTARAVRLIRLAKGEGLSITCEVTPHHFTLTEECVRGFNTNAKVNPPLRTMEDIEEIMAGLKDGTIDAIATDHAPHEASEKRTEFDNAPFGISGLETALPLSLSLYLKNILSIEEVIMKLTYNPAKILGIKKGDLSIGRDADIAIIDINRGITVDVSRFRSKGKNSPFNGFKLKGAVVMTILKGKVTFNENE